MDYTHLGRTGLKVSRLALGTMNFGELTDEKPRFSIMDEAFEAGINFFDTADVYGGPQSPDMEKGFGKSEEIIGNWLSQGGPTGLCWPPKCTSRWRSDPTIAGSPPITSVALARPACGD